ncbi:MAG: ATP-binding cassette domain-containing protein [Candidatus Cloacimonetes bacterium]|nr:ATP-binding cassette domain-containing protein [Candidatus Cloacimonadota bacterium]
MIRMRNFGFGYADKILFEAVNLELNPSGITLLTGSNGCGKTTLCRIITSLQSGYSGQILIDQKDRKNLTTPVIAEKILYLKQEPSYNFVGLTAIDNLLCWEKKFTSSDNEKTKILSLLENMDLRELSENPVWELSSGQIKRINLIALLLNQEKYWILDEPFAGLDHKSAQTAIEIISQKKSKYGSLIISHQNNGLLDIIDQKLEISDKKIIENLL